MPEGGWPKNADELAELWGVCTRTVIVRIKDGRLKALPRIPGQTWHITEAEAERFLKENPGFAKNQPK